MLFAKEALGIELCRDGVRMALVGGARTMPCLETVGIAHFPTETVRLSLREPNVLNPAAFVATVRETYLRLLTKTRRVSVSLPDATGRVVLLDLDTRFRSRSEGADIIRWKLKKSLPYDIGEAHLDFQVLEERETGEVSVLASFINLHVVNQYEELLLEAGVEPKRIDFTTFNLYRLYADRLELAENAVVMAIYGDVVSMLIIYDGILEFYRAKEIAGGMHEPNKVFRDLNSSFLAFQDKHPRHIITEAFCIADGDEAEVFLSLAGEAVNLEPLLLDAGRIVSTGDSFATDRKTLGLLTAAMGAATRNL
ncbi:MAG: pilus assembly protein PilM [Geobacteraceae bacterium]